MCDENLNLNKNLLGRWIYRKYVHIKVGSSQMCTITYKGKGGGLILSIFLHTYYVYNPCKKTNPNLKPNIKKTTFKNK